MTTWTNYTKTGLIITISIMIFNVSEAKAKLSQLIDRPYHGEQVVIAKNNLPIADIVIH